jgi:hypothetical protein
MSIDSFDRLMEIQPRKPRRAVLSDSSRMYRCMTLVFIVCSALLVFVHSLSCCLTPVISRIKPCSLFLGELISYSYNPVSSTTLLLLLPFHNDLLHYLRSRRTPPYACCSCSPSCGVQHAGNNRTCHIRQHIRQRERFAQQRRMLKRGERPRNAIPQIPHVR